MVIINCEKHHSCFDPLYGLNHWEEWQYSNPSFCQSLSIDQSWSIDLLLLNPPDKRLQMMCFEFVWDKTKTKETR